MKISDYALPVSPAALVEAPAARMLPTVGIRPAQWHRWTPSNRDLVMAVMAGRLPGANGFGGGNAQARKRTDVRGVPPRGRPV